ncbi:general substrate transporter [Lipomyces kononenkoae]|uniref:General substrate transporter n=1 Tax=Lipomyces kononenkoae TaxID=34357 RepID=A0ACC3SUR4_LIPKO
MSGEKIVQMIRSSVIEDASSVDLDSAYGPSGYRGLFRCSNIFLYSLFASLGGFLFGYDQGVISGVLVMHDFEARFPRIGGNGDLQGWVVSIMQLGAFIGALINSPIADRLSRRYSIAVACVAFLIGSVLQAGAIDNSMLFVGRFIGGIGLGQISMGVPLWIGEIAPPNLRGSAVTLQQFAIASGIMTSFWLDYGTQYIGGIGEGQSQLAWRLPFALRVVPAATLLVGCFFFLPFSPRWLVKVGREHEALEVLSRLRKLPENHPIVQAEIMQIKVGARFDALTIKEKFPNAKSPAQIAYQQYKELFTQRHLARRLFVACFLQFLQQFTGVNAIIYYAPKMFKSIGLSGNSISLLATGVVGIINVVATIPAIGIVDNFGRRGVLMVGAIFMSLSHFIIATLYAIYEHSWAEHLSAGWAAAAFVWFFVFHFAYSVGCIAWIYPTEIFPLGVRAQAMGIAISVNWISNFVIGLITPIMLSQIKFGTFYFFFAFTMVLFFWVMFFLPETKGVPMEEMDKLWGGNEGKETAERMARIQNELQSESRNVPIYSKASSYSDDVDIELQEQY